MVELLNTTQATDDDLDETVHQMYGGFSQVATGSERHKQDQRLKHTRLSHILSYSETYPVTVWQLRDKFNVLATAVRDRRTIPLIGDVENRLIDMLRVGMNSAAGGVAEGYTPTGLAHECATRLNCVLVQYHMKLSTAESSRPCSRI